MPMPREELGTSHGYHNFDAYIDYKRVGVGGSGTVYNVTRNRRRYAMRIPSQFNPSSDAVAAGRVMLALYFRAFYEIE